MLKHHAAMAILLGFAFFLATADRSLAQGFQAIDYQGAAATTVSGVSGNEVVGTYIDSKGVDHGFIKIGLAQEALNYPGTNLDTFANSISGNNIVGTCDADSPNAFGFLYNGSTYTEINYPSAVRTLALAVSGNTVVGDYYDSSWNEHGFIYNGSEYQTLDYPGATAIDLLGVSGNYIVSNYQIGIDGQSQGFLYNGSTFLPVDGPLSEGGTSVGGTDGVSVVGTYSDALGTHGFIVPISALPESTSLSLLAIGGISLHRRRRTR